jgi:cytochrome c oxidase subunit II
MKYFIPLFAALLLIGAGCADVPENVGSDQPEAVEQSSGQILPPAEDGDDSSVEDMVVETESDDDTKASAEIKDLPEDNKTTEVSKPEVKEFSMIAKKWEFEPSKITVKKGDRVRLSIKSVDVDHGFGLAAFDVNDTLKAGETTVVEFVATKAGTHTFFCSVWCGGGHPHMTGKLIVE